MSDCFSELKLYPRWSPSFQLPVGYGVTNNPNFELAVAQKILNQNDGPILDYHSFTDACIISDKSDKVNRWPEGNGGNMSHDEFTGRAYLGIDLARDDLGVMRPLGFYRNDPEYPLWKACQYRMVWAQAFIRSRANGSTCKFNQRIWAARCFLASGYPPSEGTSHILTWLMIDEMERYEICKGPAERWRAKVDMKAVMGNYFGVGSWHQKWVIK